jgi:hypothetical protein
MQKIDFKKFDKSFYTGKAGRFDILDIPPMNFLMIDGMGDPNSSPQYGCAIAALYALSYGLKFHGKASGVDHVVPPLEGLWWSRDMSVFTSGDKEAWQWTMMIRQPTWVDEDALDEVLASTIKKAAKKKGAPTDEATLREVRLEELAEGQSVQILHVGSYSDEGPILAELHQRFLPDNGLKETGKHHEIYLGDPRKVAPEKLKTILRQPVVRL